MSKVLILATGAALVASTVNISPAPADDFASTTSAFELEASQEGAVADMSWEPSSPDLEPEEVLEEGLAEEGLELEAASVDLESIEIEAEATADEDPFAFSLDLDSESATGTYTVTDEIEGEKVTTSYIVDIQTATEDLAQFTLTNPETGEVYEYDSSEVHDSIAFVIPVAFAAISLGQLLYFLAVGSAIIILGAVALEAGKAIAKIVEENNRRSSSKKRDHYPAEIQGDRVFISANGLTKSQAVSRGKRSQDVWSLTRTAAKSVAASVNVRCAPVGAENHGRGKLWHFHPCNRTPKFHSFYGYPAP